jgi:hypothetical protein
MRYPSHIRSLKHIRSLSILFATILLVACGGLLTLSAPTSAHSSGGAPIRLRLNVADSTLRSGQSTSVWVDFLDRDYQKVPNDGTRVVEFAIAPPRGNSGDLSAKHVTIKGGEWSAGTTFTSGGPGKVVVTASSEGLDSDQTTLIVTRPAASFLSRLFAMFETVAYAEPTDQLEFEPRAVARSAGNNSQAKFQLFWSPPPPADTTIIISTYPPATILYNGKNYRGFVEITLGPDKGVSDNIYISSQNVEKIEVSAAVPSRGMRASAIANFTEPGPSQILFDEDPQEITSADNNIPISLKLVDDAGNPVQSERDRRFDLKMRNEQDPVEFDPASVVFSPADKSAQAMLHLKGLPWGNELTLLAVSKGNDALKIGRKTITIRNAIAGVTVSGPSEVMRGKAGAEFNVQLVDKDDKPRRADQDRKITLSASSGAFNPAQVTIARGQDRATAQYVPANATGKVVIKAESEGLKDGLLETVLTIPPYWLVLAALFGGLIGGIVRHIPKDYKLERILPRWAGTYWELGLVGKIVGSLVGGLFLYLMVKFGIYRLMGSPALPAALDIGTRLVAFFFGGIGGFAGTVVLERLAGWFLPGPKQATQAT